MKVEIVASCWRYSRVLCYQLSSLLLFEPKQVTAQITVFYCGEDRQTADMLAFFGPLFDWAGRVTLHPWELERGEVLNRPIGRNKAALDSDADVVWFTDCDYLFREGCLDSLAGLPWDEMELAFCESIRQTQTREVGDGYAARADYPAIRDIDPRDFGPHRPRRAIGGQHIVPARVAARGYLDGYRRDQKPIPGEKFKRNTSDVRYRKTIRAAEGEIRRCHIPGVYRIRQTQFGQVDNAPDAA